MKRLKYYGLSLLVIVALGLLTPAQADVVLLQYNFEDPAGSSTFTASPTTQASGVTGSDFARDTGSMNPSTFASHTPQRSTFIQTNVTSLTAGSAGPYWTFSITSDDLLNLTDLRFAIGRVAADGNDDGPAIYNVTTSLDNHATFLLASNFEYSGAGNALSAPENQVVDLTGAEFQFLDTSSTPLVFRIYVGNERGNNNSGARIDTVILNGEFDVIPEPATAGLLALGALGLIVRRRRQQ